MKDPRIVFFGTPDFACTVLQALIDGNYQVVAAVSQPDRPVGRKHVIMPTPVHALAEENSIPVLQPEKLRQEADEILAYQPDLIVTCAYGQIVPDTILQYPQLGCVNIHPSLLPKYRGGAPIHHAILNGDDRTGVCLMEMVRKMDAGRVFACHEVAIGEDMTTAELEVILKEESIRIINEELPRYIAGELEGIEQDEEHVVLAPNISREMEQVRFAKEDVNTAYNHIRGLIDWPVSYGVLEGRRYRFYKAAKQIKAHDNTPGEVLGYENGAMNIAAKGGIIKIYELQPEGKKPMGADQFANGAGRSLVGKVFE